MFSLLESYFTLSFRDRDLDIDPMTLICKLNLFFLKLYLRTSRFAKMIDWQTVKQTSIQTLVSPILCARVRRVIIYGPRPHTVYGSLYGFLPGYRYETPSYGLGVCAACPSEVRRSHHLAAMHVVGGLGLGWVMRPGVGVDRAVMPWLQTATTHRIFLSNHTQHVGERRVERLGGSLSVTGYPARSIHQSVNQSFVLAQVTTRERQIQRHIRHSYAYNHLHITFVH